MYTYIQLMYIHLISCFHCIVYTVQTQ